MITETGDTLGILPIDEALTAAADAGLDLVEVGPDAQPAPVCRLMNYSRTRYEAERKERVNKRNTRDLAKDIKFRAHIDVHDYTTKKKHIVRFLNEGRTVRVTVMLKGREIGRPQLGIDLLNRLVTDPDIEPLITPANMPAVSGRDVHLTLQPRP